jgi:hypothetical protein
VLPGITPPGHLATAVSQTLAGPRGGPDHRPAVPPTRGPHRDRQLHRLAMGCAGEALHASVASISRRRSGTGRCQTAPASDDAVTMASQDDEGILARTSSRSEFRKSGASVQRKVGRERLTSDRQCPAICMRIGHDQHEVLDDLIVAQLEHRSALDRLQVRESRFSLEGVDASMAVSDCVPCTHVGSAKERNFGPQANATAEPISQATDEADLTDVPDGIGVRIEPQVRNQADGHSESAELLQADVAQLPSLESIHLARRYADRVASIGPA